MDIQKEREEFEAWLFREYPTAEDFVIVYGPDENIYEHCPTQARWEAWQAAKAQAIPEGFVVCKSEPVAYIVQNKFWKQKFDVKSVKGMPPQKWEDDHYDVEIPLYAVSLDGLVLKEQDEGEAND